MGRAARMATSSLHVTDGVLRCPSRTTPAFAGAGSEQIPRRPGPEQHDDCRRRPEPAERARGRHAPRDERQLRKKLEPSPERLLGLLHRWRDEAVRAGRTITRVGVSFEAGRDGVWL